MIFSFLTRGLAAQIMERTYEGLFILDTNGKDEGSKELVEKLEKEIQQAGGKTQKIERMDKRPFSRVAHKISEGYYVNIVFSMTPEKLDAFRGKLKLNDDVFRAYFQRGDERLKASPKAQVAA